jgi:hypothetical protein
LLPTVLILAFYLGIVITLHRRKKEQNFGELSHQTTAESDASTKAILFAVSVTYFFLTFPWAVQDLISDFNTIILCGFQPFMGSGSSIGYTASEQHSTLPALPEQLHQLLALLHRGIQVSQSSAMTFQKDDEQYYLSAL